MTRPLDPMTRRARRAGYQFAIAIVLGFLLFVTGAVRWPY